MNKWCDKRHGGIPYEANEIHRLMKEKHLGMVRDFYSRHLGCSLTECAHAVGLHYQTVGKYVRMLRKEWKDDR